MEPVVTEVTWARHGENLANVTRTFSHRAVDPDLTDRGVREAHALAERLSGGPAPAVLACSPLRRTRRTAQIVADRLGIPLAEVIEDLREVDVGALDGRGDPASWRVYGTILAAWSHGDLDARFPGGEDGTELAARLRRALTQVAALAGPGAAVVVAHGANLRAAVPPLTGAPDPGVDLDTGGIARLHVHPGATPGTTLVELRSWNR